LISQRPFCAPNEAAYLHLCCAAFISIAALALIFIILIVSASTTTSFGAAPQFSRQCVDRILTAHLLRCNSVVLNLLLKSKQPLFAESAQVFDLSGAVLLNKFLSIYSPISIIVS
jgi:hypothetical protein